MCRNAASRACPAATIGRRRRRVIGAPYIPRGSGSFPGAGRPGFDRRRGSISGRASRHSRCRDGGFSLRSLHGAGCLRSASGGWMSRLGNGDGNCGEAGGAGELAPARDRFPRIECTRGRGRYGAVTARRKRRAERQERQKMRFYRSMRYETSCRMMHSAKKTGNWRPQPRSRLPDAGQGEDVDFG